MAPVPSQLVRMSAETGPMVLNGYDPNLTFGQNVENSTVQALNWGTRLPERINNSIFWTWGYIAVPCLVTFVLIIFTLLWFVWYLHLRRIRALEEETLALLTLMNDHKFVSLRAIRDLQRRTQDDMSSRDSRRAEYFQVKIDGEDIADKILSGTGEILVSGDADITVERIVQVEQTVEHSSEVPGRAARAQRYPVTQSGSKTPSPPRLTGA